jgi:tetratricopeptide (TPR) repeat protein
MKVKLLVFLLFPLVVFSQPTKEVIKERQKMEFDKRFFAGMKEKMIKNYDEAIFEFKEAIKLEPNNANVHYQLATVLLSTKHGEEAIDEAERAFKLEPSNDWYAKFLIELYKSNQRYEDAISKCEMAYKKTKDAHYLLEIANLWILNKKPEKAISALNRYEKQQGVTENVSRQKEEIYLSKGDIKAATSEIEKLCNAYPTQLNYKGILADLYMNSNKQKEALKIYQEIQKADSLNGFAAFSIAEYYQEVGDTQACFEQLLLGMKSNLEPKFKMQVLARLYPSNYFGSDQKEKCQALNEAFLQANPEAVEPYVFYGDLLLQEKKTEEARAYYLQAVSKSANYLLAWDQILFCDQQLLRYDWMKEDCEKIMPLFPDYPTAYLLHGVACRQLKVYQVGLGFAQLGVSMASDETMLIQMLSSLGDMAHYAGKFETSDSAFEAVLSIAPSNSMALNNFAYFLSLRNVDLDKAANMSKRSIELDPGNPSNLDTYAWILYMRGEYLEAKKQILKSLELSPNNAEVVEHFGDILYRLNEVEDANVQWKKAKVLGGSSNELDAKIKNKSLPKN